MKINWNFLGEGGGVQNKTFDWGEYGYFLELHNDGFFVAHHKLFVVLL